MRRSLLAAVLISLLLASGCGFFNKDSDGQKPAAEEGQQPGQQSAGSTSGGGQTSSSKPPSFQDGDYYLQALSSKSLELCAKIQNVRLKDRCEVKVKEAGEATAE